VVIQSPFERHYYLVAPGLRMFYVLEGTLGDPVVFVHGNPTWSYFFRSLIADLRDSHVCIAPDHIGCGLSDKPPDSEYDYTLKDRIDDLDRLLRHLVPAGPVNLVVHDWGGMIGMGWAVRYPERVKRLVILNTAAFMQREGKPLPWQIWVVRDTFLGPLLVQGLNAFSRGLVTFCAKKTLPREVREMYLAPYDSWSHRLAVLKFVQDIPQKPGDTSYALAKEIEAGLEQFRDTPALICWGMRDFVFDADFLADWQRRLPKAEVHRFEDAHHLVLEDAGERIVPLVRRFLGG
jgi:haloalkane dehalogenase